MLSLDFQELVWASLSKSSLEPEDVIIVRYDAMPLPDEPDLPFRVNFREIPL
jgi:hypothetical protein